MEGKGEEASWLHRLLLLLIPHMGRLDLWDRVFLIIRGGLEREVREMIKKIQVLYHQI